MLIVRFDGQLGEELRIEADANLAGTRIEPREQTIIESAAAPEPRAIGGECDAGHEDEIQRVWRHGACGIAGWLADSECAGGEFVQRCDAKEVEAAFGHARVGECLSRAV